ncbi:relaxase domain-containing protein, partial [Acidithiobacillus ferridurans]|uniref:MobF family relaxase n=1 Tax=Acidithiobacillus ferridurans TaxID=1232575 RepID=UPI001C06519A
MQTVSALNLVGGSAAGIVKYAKNEQQAHKGKDGQEYTTGYYQNGAPGQWHGKLAEELGLSGAVSDKVLQDILEGRLPDGTIFADAAKNPERRAGNDLTLSAPKSVSIMALAGGDERIIAAHDAAVRKAMDYLESEVISARYGKGGKESIKTGNAIFAAFRHEDARPVDGHTDPQLHTHCLQINVTRGRDGDLRATDLDFGENAVRMHTSDAIYKAELAHSLKEMGYDIRKTRDGFELASVSDQQIEEFSARRQQIDVALSEAGLSRENSTAHERTVANLATRESKGNPTQEELQWDWRDRARESGIDLSAVAAKEVVREAVNDRLSQGESNGNQQQYFRHGSEEAELHADENPSVELSIEPDHVRNLSLGGLAGVKEWEREGVLQDPESVDRHGPENVRREPTAGGSGGITEPTAAESAVSHALDHLSERQSVLSREQVLLESLKSGIGDADSSQIREAF